MCSKSITQLIYIVFWSVIFPLPTRASSLTINLDFLSSLNLKVVYYNLVFKVNHLKIRGKTLQHCIGITGEIRLEIGFKHRTLPC